MALRDLVSIKEELEKLSQELRAENDPQVRLQMINKISTLLGLITEGARIG